MRQHKRPSTVQIIIVLLVLQYVLGMLSNLYATIPSSKPYLVFEEYGFIEFHALNGVLLLILAVVCLVRSIKLKRHVRESIGGLSSLTFAFACGEAFVFTQNDIFSLLMSLAFLGAFISYLKLMIWGATGEPQVRA